jgi:hypothetical protein
MIARNLKKLLVGLTTAALFSAPAIATPWVEVGDAGDTIASAQGTFQPVTSISGSLFGSENGPFAFDLVDIYRISVGAPTFLSITTAPGNAADSINDPVLYLFDSAGMALVMNDDDGINGTQSTIGPLSPIYLPGNYYIAVTFSGAEPLSAAGASLFDAFGSFLAISTDPLASWTGGPLTTNFDVPGVYELALTTIPVPSGLLLLVPGLLGLGAVRRSIRAVR